MLFLYCNRYTEILFVLQPNMRFLKYLVSVLTDQNFTPGIPLFLQCFFCKSLLKWTNHNDIFELRKILSKNFSLFSMNMIQNCQIFSNISLKKVYMVIIYFDCNVFSVIFSVKSLNWADRRYFLSSLKKLFSRETRIANILSVWEIIELCTVGSRNSHNSFFVFDLNKEFPGDSLY